MIQIRPVSDLRNKFPDVEKAVACGEPVYLTKNGYGAMVVLSLEAYSRLTLEHELKQISEDLAKRIMHKIDIDWTDLLWKYRGDNNIVDDEFLRYFRFVCDVLCYKKEGRTQGKKFNEFDALKEYFSKEADNAMKNIELLESFFMSGVI